MSCELDPIKFQTCLAQARQIVAEHRAEAPQGCDPQNTWVAVGVLVVKDVAARADSGDWFGVGGGIFGTPDQEGAGGGGSAKGAFKPLKVPEPAEVEFAAPEEVLGRWRGEVTGHFPEYSHIADLQNVDEQKAAQKANLMANPDYYSLLGAQSNLAQSYARGEIPADVKEQIFNNASENALTRGFSYGRSGGGGNTYANGNDASANLALKNLGLTSLDLTKVGSSMISENLGQSRASRGRVISATDVLPTQAFFVDQMNMVSQGDYMNEQNQNNYEAAKANAPQQAAYNQMLFRQNMMTNQQAQSNAQSAAQSQQFAQIAQAVGSYYSGQYGGGASAAGSSGSGAAVGSSINGAYGTSANGTNYYGSSPYSSQTTGSWGESTWGDGSVSSGSNSYW